MPPAHRRHLTTLALAAGWAAAHVCLLAPAQRSGLPADLGALPGGADACYSSRKCPPRVAGGPVTALAGGQGFVVLLLHVLLHQHRGLVLFHLGHQEFVLPSKFLFGQLHRRRRRWCGRRWRGQCGLVRLQLAGPCLR